MRAFYAYAGFVDDSTKPVPRAHRAVPDAALALHTAILPQP